MGTEDSNPPLFLLHATVRDSVARKDGIKNIMIYVNAVRSGQTPISMDGGAKAKMQVNRFYIVSMTIIKTYS